MATGSARKSPAAWATGIVIAVAVLAIIGWSTGAGSGSGKNLRLASDALPAATETAAPGASASPSATPAESVTLTGAPSATPTVVAPVVTLRTVVIKQRIGFAKKVVKDKNLAKGTKKVTRKGRSGYRDRIYRYTYSDKKLVKRTLIKIKITRKPVGQITHVGTKVASAKTCDPNYSGCVPIASDVDCAGGSGNGPEYVRGPVTVIGDDIYGLDADHDGIGCE